MLDRINKVIKTNQISASEFAEKIGVQRSTISHVLSGRNKPGLDLVVKILENYPDVDAEWLLLGKETNHSSPPQSGQFAPQKDQQSQAESNDPKTGIKQEEKQIEKVVIFYTDKTFESYHQNG